MLYIKYNIIYINLFIIYKHNSYIIKYELEKLCI